VSKPPPTPDEARAILGGLAGMVDPSAITILLMIVPDHAPDDQVRIGMVLDDVLYLLARPEAEAIAEGMTTALDGMTLYTQGAALGAAQDGPDA
jgi:hypothetical protein